VTSDTVTLDSDIYESQSITFDINATKTWKSSVRMKMDLMCHFPVPLIGLEVFSMLICLQLPRDTHCAKRGIAIR